jgi:multidrug transporter EmrE-like cation transporter
VKYSGENAPFIWLPAAVVLAVVGIVALRSAPRSRRSKVLLVVLVAAATFVSHSLAVLTFSR